MGWNVDSFGNAVGDFLSFGASDAAKEQEVAAQNASAASIADAKKQREFLLEQAALGRTFIDQGTADARGQLGTYDDKSREALAAGLHGQIAGTEQGQGRLAALMNGGLNDYKRGPDYDYRQRMGEQAIMRGASARGGRHGGATLQSLMGFNQDLASNDFNNYANRQIGLTNQMVGMDQQRGAMAGQQGSQLAQLYSGTGANLAGIASNSGIGMANLGMGAAAQNSQIGQSVMNAYQNPVQYAGAGAAANGAMMGNLVNLGATGLVAAYANQPQQVKKPGVP